ncbi:MAG TPA: antitoxin MazE family protein [Vicinamibacterales bacterium]|nr:antitoxin MazE family protein [Vicinamibacterales bacterium]
MNNRAKSRDKVRAHRERLRRLGLRPIQIWVPDVRSKAFLREARRQSRLIAGDPAESDNQAFADAVQDWGNWDDRTSSRGGNS